jgi:hypothetical protein
MKILSTVFLCMLTLSDVLPVLAGDWPQLQHDAARTGRTSDTVLPPFRIRWMWTGPARTFRNRDSVAGWTDDLSARPAGFTTNVEVGITIGSQAQPVIASGRVFIGTQEGQAFGIGAYDGSTLWTGSIPGGTLQSAAVASTASGEIVIFVCLNGMVYGLRADTGATAWTFDSGFSITGAPCVAGGRVFVGNHGGWVCGLDAASGSLAWKTPLLAPIQGGLASDGASIYVGADSMKAYALSADAGAVRASRQLRGQSFRMTFPMIFDGLAYFTTVMTPRVGSEYVMEALMDDATSLADEEAKIARWLQGDTNGGRWGDATPDFRHLFALNTSALSEPFTVLSGPSEGCGQPAEPPVVDRLDRVLCWWKTRFPKLTSLGAFGTKYAIDIAAVNTTNGHRIPFEFGANNNRSPAHETDNLFALSVAGDYLWLRQRFRGTRCIRLTDNTYKYVQHEAYFRDGGDVGGYGYDVWYGADDASLPRAAHRSFAGHIAVSISGNQAYLSEEYGVVALEHKP